MPTRLLRHRVATVLLSVLYLLAWGEPVALHPCPMHDGAGMAVVHGGHAMAAMGGPHDGGMAAHTAQTAAAGHRVDHGAPAGGHGAHTCQCLGHGCCAAAVAVPAARQQVRWFAVVTRRADPPAIAPTPPRATAPRRLRPPATGPPALG